MHDSLTCFWSLDTHGQRTTHHTRARGHASTNTHTHTTLLLFCVRLLHITLQESYKSEASSLVLQYVSEFKVVFPSVVKAVSYQTRGKCVVAEECCQVTLRREMEADVL